MFELVRKPKRVCTSTMAQQESVSPGEFSPVLLQYSSLFLYNISFIGPLLGEFDGILQPFSVILDKANLT